MGIFGGKKKKQKYEIEDELDEEDDAESEDRIKKFKKRDFKDLHPENKRKRKELPKPWGKKERITILILILATAGYAAVLYLSTLNMRLPAFPNIPKFESLKLPELPNWSEKTYVIERDGETFMK